MTSLSSHRNTWPSYQKAPRTRGNAQPWKISTSHNKALLESPGRSYSQIEPVPTWDSTSQQHYQPGVRKNMFFNRSIDDPSLCRIFSIFGPSMPVVPSNHFGKYTPHTQGEVTPAENQHQYMPKTISPCTDYLAVSYSFLSFTSIFA